MKRTELEAMGLTKEQVDSIMKINGDDIENAKSASAAEISGLNTQVSDRDKQLETLKSTAGDNEALTQQIADLQAANAKAKETHESEMNQLKIDFAVEKALTAANAKNVKAVRALLDLEGAKLDREGNVKGLQDQIDKNTQGTFQGYQPGVAAPLTRGTGVDTTAMSYDQLCAYLEQNPDAMLE